jgi:hypothetical protein
MSEATVRRIGLTAALIMIVAVCRAASDSAGIPDDKSIARDSLSSVSAMTVARAAHTATTLADGRVLLVGGLDPGGSTAELFDPRTRAFSRTASLGSSRAGHTASQLPDGRVLIAGGYNGNYLSSTEIYDPRSGTFEPGPTMLQPRSGHLAVPLSDGRVLFVGGVSTDWAFLSSAELFDPVSRRFTSTGSMSLPRESHVGVLLSDGTVLVAGGHTGRRQNIQIHASAERYDPARGVFVATGAMTKRRHKHAGIVLRDGRVLITGGADERDDRGQYRDVETYDPATGRFARAGEMRRSRYKHDGSMVLLRDGTVLLAGGAADAEVFDQTGNVFSLVPGAGGLPGSFSAVARLSDGSVLITGGYGNGMNVRASAWLYTSTAR